MAQKFPENIPSVKVVTTPQAVNEPVCAAKKVAADGAVPAEKWIARQCAELSGMSYVKNFRNHRMYAMSVLDAESVRQTESTTSPSRRTQWQSADIRRPEASLSYREKNWLHWMPL